MFDLNVCEASMGRFSPIALNATSSGLSVRKTVFSEATEELILLLAPPMAAQ